jgi:hypothetical protein
VTEIGYFLSSEEHGPRELVHQAQLAADAGIGGVWISDHFHPWLDEQGESRFAWGVIGAIAATTDLTVTTAVTCPIMRIHPASELVTVEATGEKTAWGPDPAPMIEAVKGYVDAGFDRLYINQMGPDQEGFFKFFRDELMPALEEMGAVLT